MDSRGSKGIIQGYRVVGPSELHVPKPGEGDKGRNGPFPGDISIDTERTAFEILVQEHSPMILAFIRAQVRDSASIEDIHQETMVTAWRTLDRFDQTRPFGPWLRGIARNHILVHYRRTRRLPLHCEEAVIAHLDARLEEIGRRSGDTWPEKLEALEDCLGALPEPSRTLLDLHYREELSTERIAGRTDLNRETVKKRLQRIRSSLARCLEQKGILAPFSSPTPSTS